MRDGRLRKQPHTLVYPTIVGTLGLAVIGAASGQGTPAAAPSAKAPQTSRGLVNDWLQEESPGFKAWDIGGQVRGRYELFDDGSPAFPNRDFQKEGADNDNAYWWFREKLHVGYKSTWIGAYAEGRNSNAIDDKDHRNPGEDSFDLHQAYVTLGNAKEFPVTAKVGRQELLYGDERLVGPSDWSNTGRVFDAAKLRYECKDLWLDAFAGRVVVPVDGEFNEPDYHEWFFGLVASSKTLVPVQETQLYVFSRNAATGAAGAPRDIYSIGARVKSLPGKLHDWDYSAEMVGQVGSINQGGQRLDQEALAATVSGGYTFTDVPAAPRVGLEYSYSSGDSDPNDDQSNTLDNLYPTNHRHYGYMDFVGWRNIHNPRVALSAKPAKGLMVSLDYHLFWLADTHDAFYPQSGSGRSGNGYGRNPGYSSFVGSEINLDAAYALTPWAGLRAGYGHFFVGGYVNDSKAALGGATDADWFYVQATINF